MVTKKQTCRAGPSAAGRGKAHRSEKRRQPEREPHDPLPFPSAHRGMLANGIQRFYPAVMVSGTLFERLGGRTVIERLVTSFYEHAQRDPVLGPVFAAQVHDWPSHIQTVSHFWSTQTGGPPLYRGGMGKHIRLGLQPEHFQRWLALWEENAIREVGPESAAELKAIGQIFAQRLQEMARLAGAPPPGFRFTAN